MTNVPFKRPIGIELTFVPKDPDPWHLDSDNFIWGGTGGVSPTNRSWEELTNLYKRYAVDAGIPGASNIYNDIGCVEFPSPILKSWEEAEAWYRDAVGIGELAHMTPYEPSQEGGCGHIHMGISNDTLENMKLRRQLFIEVLKRPWLSWVFVSPNVVPWARSLVNGFTAMAEFILDEAYNRDLYSGSRRQPLTKATAQRVLSGVLQEHERRRINLDKVVDLNTAVMGYLDARPLDNGVFCTRDHILRFSSKTVEWRAFDSAATWEEQAAAIKFYQTFVDWAETQNSGSLLNEYNPAWIGLRNKYACDFSACQAEFKKLISDLALPWDDYKDLIRINLRPAFDFGERL